MPQRHTTLQAARGDAAARLTAQPHLALLHSAMLLTGFSTVFLGPVLPRLAAATHTTDSGSGLFFTAQFLGAFLGGVTTSPRLWQCLLRGCGAAAAGFLLLGLGVHVHATLPWCAAALLPLGYGVGQTITTVNLLTSQRYTTGRGAALSRVNFSWSLGAVLAPFLLGNLLAKNPLQFLLAGASALFLLALLGAAWNAQQRRHYITVTAEVEGSTGTLHMSGFVYFAALLFLYGGVETALGGWTTTFGQRYSSGSAGALGTTVLWLGLTAGRALVPLLLRGMRERTLLTSALILATLLTVLLSRSTGGVDMVVLCALLGLSLAPWFPLVFADIMRVGAGATQAGSILAVSGIGAAVLPFLVGALSRSTGSLRLALGVPVAGLAILVGLSFHQVLPRGAKQRRRTEQTPAGV